MRIRLALTFDIERSRKDEPEYREVDMSPTYIERLPDDFGADAKAKIGFSA